MSLRDLPPRVGRGRWRRWQVTCQTARTAAAITLGGPHRDPMRGPDTKVLSVYARPERMGSSVRFPVRQSTGELAPRTRGQTDDVVASRAVNAEPWEQMPGMEKRQCPSAATGPCRVKPGRRWGLWRGSGRRGEGSDPCAGPGGSLWRERHTISGIAQFSLPHAPLHGSVAGTNSTIRGIRHRVSPSCYGSELPNHFLRLEQHDDEEQDKY
jgi:hypothetical protein